MRSSFGSSETCGVHLLLTGPPSLGTSNNVFWLRVGLLVTLAACGSQAPKDVTVVSTTPTAGASTAVESDCARRHEATELAARADASMNVHVMGAIAQYREASALAPTDHTILFRLALALKKTENWEEEQVALVKAAELAPEFANYWYELGLSFVRQAEAGDREAYERAKAPFDTCTRTDPNFAECWYGLAESALWTDELELAMTAHTRAVERDPSKTEFYLALANIYLDLKRYPEARGVLEVATTRLERNAPELYRIHLLLAEVHAAAGDSAKRTAALEVASDLAPLEEFEVWYLLASAYVESNPVDTEKARRALQLFRQRGCRGDVVREKKERDWLLRRCEEAQWLAQRLGT
jgi:tetratricopeptide (TPR) repeat protein